MSVMKRTKIITYLYVLYIILMFWATSVLNVGRNNGNHIMLAWVVFSISCGATYGYYSFYRDMKLFGWKWIKDTFKQLLKIK